MSASYFDHPLHAKKLKDEALSWIGMPFSQFDPANFEQNRAELKALGLPVPDKPGGIDCVGLVSEIYTRIGATDKWMFPREPADYQSHQLGEKVLDWLRGKADDPQSKLLSKIFTELEIPEAVTDPHGETPRDFFKPGDVLVLRHGELFHMPVIIDDDLHFVNALPRIGVIEGTIQDSSFSIHLIAAFRLKPKE